MCMYVCVCVCVYEEAWVQVKENEDWPKMICDTAGYRQQTPPCTAWGAGLTITDCAIGDMAPGNLLKSPTVSEILLCRG